MIIDCHGHYTTEPQQLHDFRKKQTEAASKHQHLAPGDLKITDDQIRESLDASKRVLAFITDSAESSARDYIFEEMEVARSQNKLVPIIIRSKPKSSLR